MGGKEGVERGSWRGHGRGIKESEGESWIEEGRALGGKRRDVGWGAKGACTPFQL